MATAPFPDEGPAPFFERKGGTGMKPFGDMVLDLMKLLAAAVSAVAPSLAGPAQSVYFMLGWSLAVARVRTTRKLLA